MSDSTYIKNYDIGTATLDLPYFFYKHRLDLTSFGDDVIQIPVGFACYSRGWESGADARIYNQNLFGMIPGMKLTAQKKILSPLTASEALLLISGDGSVTEFLGSGSRYMATDGSGRSILKAADGTATLTAPGDANVEIYNADGDISEIRRKTSPTEETTLVTYGYHPVNGVSRMTRVTRVSTVTDLLVEYDTAGRICKLIMQSDVTCSQFWNMTVSYSPGIVLLTLSADATYVYNFSDGLCIDSVFYSSEYGSTRERTVTCTRAGDTVTVTYQSTERFQLLSQTAYTCLHYEQPHIGDFFEIKDRYGVRTRYQYIDRQLAYTYEVPGDETDVDGMFYVTNVPGTNMSCQAYKADVSLLRWQNFCGKLQQEALIERNPQPEYCCSFIIPHQHDSSTCPVHWFLLSGWLRGSAGSGAEITLKFAGGGTITTIETKALHPDKWMFFSQPVCLTDSATSAEVYVTAYDFPDLTAKKVRFGDIRLTPIDRTISVTRTVFVKKTNPTEKFYPDNSLYTLYSYKDASGTRKNMVGKPSFTELYQKFYREKKDSDNRQMYIGETNRLIDYCTDLCFEYRNADNTVTTYNLAEYYLGTETTGQAVQTLQYFIFDSTDTSYYRSVTETTYQSVPGTCVQYYNFRGQPVRAEETSGSKHRVTEYTYNSMGLPLSKKYIPAYSATAETAYTEETNEAHYYWITSHTDANGIKEQYYINGMFGNRYGTIWPDGVSCEQEYDVLSTAVTKTSLKSATQTQTVVPSYEEGHLIKTAQNSLNYYYEYSCENLANVKYGTDTAKTTLYSATYDDTTRTYGTVSSAGRNVVRTEDVYGRTVTKKVGGANAVTVTYGGMTWRKGTHNAESVNGSSYVTKSVDHVTSETTTYSRNTIGTSESVSSETKNTNGKKTKTTYTRSGTSDNSDIKQTKFYDPVSERERTASESTLSCEPRVAMGQPGRIPVQLYSTVSYTKDDNVKESLSLTETFTYDAFDRISALTRTSGEFVVNQTMLYESTGNKNLPRLQQLKQKDSAGFTLHTDSYQYDACGRISSVSGVYVTSYVYDGLGRLVRENNRRRNKTYTYAYDAYGNMTVKNTYTYTTGEIPASAVTTQTYTYGDSARPDRLTAVDGKPVGYASNTKTHITSFDGKTYKWTNGLFSGYTVGNATDGMETYTYKYNGQGQRISKRYTFTPGNQTLAEYTASIVQDFVYNVDGTLHMMTKTTTDQNGSSSTKRLVFLYDSTGVSGCMYSVNNGTPVTYYFIRDALGDISSVCNAAGRIRAEYAYDAYGNCAISGDFSNGFAEENPFRYRGYFYDTETGFYYCQTRYYNPAWGRFISMDSPDYLSPDSVAGMNLYVYCNNDPVNFSDPTGHFAISTFLISLAVGTLISWGLSEIFGVQIAGGISAITNGGSAIATGVCLCAFGPIGILAGIALTLVGIGTVAFGANEIVAGATGTNYIQQWTNMSDSLYNGLNIGFNIASSLGTIVGNIGMGIVSTAKLSAVMEDPATIQNYNRFQFKMYARYSNKWTLSPSRNGKGMKALSRTNTGNAIRYGYGIDTEVHYNGAYYWVVSNDTGKHRFPYL